MLIAHVGLDGSGKSYGMAQDAELAISKGRKEVWSLLPIKGAKRIKHPHQIIFLTNSIIFLDELQRFYPADRSVIDELTHHIISMHRHDKNTIHWASQAWEYVHPFWRRETAFVWEYEAIHRDPLTGESRWFGTPIHRHVRQMITGVDKELGRRRVTVHKEKKFFITKKGISLFDSYEKIDVMMKDEITEEYLQELGDPHYQQSAPTDALVDKEAKAPREHDALVPEHKRQQGNKRVPGKHKANDAKPVIDVVEPVEHKGGKRIVINAREDESQQPDQ